MHKPSPFVCRNLFGKVDHRDLKASLIKQLNLIDNENCNKWNFDFAKERPIPGDYSWENVDKVPFVYKVTQLEYAMLSECSKFMSKAVSDTKADISADIPKIAPSFCPDLKSDL